MTISRDLSPYRTPEGDRFAKSVGGESLPCLHGCCTFEED